MKQPSEDNKQKKRRKTLHSLGSVSALLLSVVCCMALIRVEPRIQEHHRLISHSVTVCDQMETQILRKVQQNYERWQVRKVDNFKDHRQETNGEDQLENNLRFSLIPIYILVVGGGGGGGGVLSTMAYLTGKALPEKGTFFRLQSRGFTS